MGVQHIRQVGDHYQVFMTDGSSVMCFASGGGVWRPGTTIAPPPPPPPPSTSAQDALVAWMVAHIGAYAYSQASGRLTPDTSGYTDCSGLTYWCYEQVLGMNIGTWTGSQNRNGTQIEIGSGAVNEALLVHGDLIFYNWTYYKSGYDHVDMYTGPNQAIGHGGPGAGPTYKNNLAGRTAGAHDWKVVRYV